MPIPIPSALTTIQRIPSKMTKTYLSMHRKLQEIEAEVVQFTDLPTHSPSADHLAQHIVKRFGFLRKQLTAERASYGGSLPYDLLEIETRLVELEAEFYRANSNPPNVVVVENDVVVDNDVVVKNDVVVEKVVVAGEDDDSGSVCESCLNDDVEFERETRSVFGVPEMLHEVVVPQQPLDVFHESLTSPSDPEKVEETTFDCKWEKIGNRRRRRWWWRTVAVLMMVSAVVSLSSYFDNNQHEGFLTPT